MPETYVSEAMAAAVGRELERRVSYPIAASDIRRWAVAVYYPDEPHGLFWDEAYAAATRFGGVVAPEDFNPFAWMAAEPPGVARREAYDAGSTERRLGVPPPGVSFQLNGGLQVEYGVRMRPGDVVRSEMRLAGYHEREGRLCRMLFTDLETTWTNQRDELVKRTISTLIRY